MAILTNRQIIDSPAPGVRRYGVFDAATVTDDLTDRMIASGFQFADMDCMTDVSIYDANCDTHPTKTFTEGMGYNGGDPYWLYAAKNCGTVGQSPEEIETAIRRAFASGEQTMVEQVIWSGDGATQLPYLTDPAMPVTTVTPLAPGAGAAIAALEAAFYAEYGYAGTIHMNQQGYAAVVYAGLVQSSGGAGVLTTQLRSRWSFGAGYDITGPAGVAPAAGSVWAFMTAQTLIKRQPTVNVPDIRQTLDRATNQYNALAERVYAHAFACDIVMAVEVPISAPGVVVLA
jgi:hypothetical protein